MAAEHAEHALTPSGYIQHHLSFMMRPVGDHPFLSVNLDSLTTSVLLGILGFGFMWLVVRRATAGVPGKRQAVVEIAIEFVNDQVKSVFHGNIATIAPLALTVFVWVLLMNSMDFLPIDLMGKYVYTGIFGLEEWRHVPTADVNTTFALALAVWTLMIYYTIKVVGYTNYSARHLAATRCFGCPTFCLTWWNISRSLCRTVCDCTGTCLRARLFFSCSDCGRRPVWSAPS